MAKITINKKVIEASLDKTILQVAKENNILIPHLCYLEGIHEIGSCRLCVVEIEGMKNLMASCITKIQDGMDIKTNSNRVRNARKILYELILSDHPKNCLSCERNENCELQALGGIIQANQERFEGIMSKDIYDNSSVAIERDMSKCIMCRRCETMCNEIQGVGILNTQGRGFKSTIGAGQGLMLVDVACTFCGQCTKVCPVGALKEKSSVEEVWEAINDNKKVVVVQTAPAVRVALGEEFGYEAGTLVTGKMATALRELGFDYIFDTNFAADLTIIEEGNELLERLKNKVNGEETILPLITSCSPGWIKYIEHYYSEQIDNLSSCKSPHMMLGALSKSYFADKEEINPEDMFVVSIMPCTAKKFEITRPEMENNGQSNVDAVLTTREFANMIKDAGIDFRNLVDGHFDSPLGLSSGAADIFGNTGGVMEAAIRTVYELITGRELPFDKLHVKPLMGLEKIKTASLLIQNPLVEWKALDGIEVHVAVTSGLDGAGKLLEEIKNGKSIYHFIEVMACPGGCINGGGQPRANDDPSIIEKRIRGLYHEDESKNLRKSHENEAIINLYERFLGKPLGHLSHELLHTTYTKRKRFQD